MIPRLLTAIRIALSELVRNLTRTALTSLGILIGVGAVIAMVGLGQGATDSIEADLAGMGVNMLMVTPGTGRGPHARVSAPAFKRADADAIASQVPRVAAVAPIVNASAEAVRGGTSWKTTVYGTGPGWLDVTGRRLSLGRMLTEGETRAGTGVCVIGETVRTELFGRREVLGGSIRLGDVTCTVIGVLEAEGQNTMGMDQDDMVVVPITLAQRRLLGTADVQMIFVSAQSTQAMDGVAEGIDAVMRQRRHVTSDAALNFDVRDTREVAAMVTGITDTMTLFLAAVAAVSLLVGGIGIMNIMLVSVTERTREIGIRMAVGALEVDVMTQFLVEAVVLSGFGGILGVLFGVTATWIGSRWMGIPFVVDPMVVALAVGFSALMGVAFGWWPARRAARLEPIDALRHT